MAGKLIPRRWQAGWPRRARLLATLLAAGSLGALCAGCGNGAALGEKACHLVGESIASYDASLHAPSAAARSDDRSEALDQLRAALQPAAQANAADGHWQALMATISQSPQVPEQQLIYALTAQCAGVTGSGIAGGSGGSGGSGSSGASGPS